MKRKILSLITAFTLLAQLVAGMPVASLAAEPETGGEGAKGMTADQIQVGDYIQLGNYNGKPIKWRCIGYGSPTNPKRYNFSSDTDYTMYESDSASGEVPLFLSDEVICKKAFDAFSAKDNTKPSSHDKDNWRTKCGSNQWIDSNIRDWLNSDAPEGEVLWSCGNPPSAENLVDSNYKEGGKYAYDQEAGFLTNFTPDEQMVMMTVRQKNILGAVDADLTDSKKQYGYDRFDDGNFIMGIDKFSSEEYEKCYYRLSMDTMFLLDIKQLDGMYKNCTADKLGEKYWCNAEYYLRSPLVRMNTNDVYIKGVDGKGKFINYYNVYNAVGIRPAFYARKTAAVASGAGSADDPYILRTPFASSADELSAKNIKVGDYVELGTYYGEKIKWRCIGFDRIGRYEADGTPVRTDENIAKDVNEIRKMTAWQEGYVPVMMSDEILTFKPFDAVGTRKEGAQTSHERGDRFFDYDPDEDEDGGSNYWGDSNLRSWLNSDAKAGEVEWLCGNPPDAEHVYDGIQPYDNEAGFLNGFSDEEIGAIKEVSRRTVISRADIKKSVSGTAPYEDDNYQFTGRNQAERYENAYAEYNTDKIFLPDAWHIAGVIASYSAAYEAKVSSRGYPTKQALARKDSRVTSKSDCYQYWIGTPSLVDSSVYTVDYDKDVRAMAFPQPADVGYVGVRPAFYLNVDVSFKQGDGREVYPYSFQEPEKTSSVKVGEYVQMGTYGGDPVLWRCVGEDRHGPLMISDRILDIKPYDASGTGGSSASSHYRSDDLTDKITSTRRTSGSNYWGDSNICVWLNSADKAGEIKWSCGNPPNAAHVYKGINAYDLDEGFLRSFTKHEQMAIYSFSGDGDNWYRYLLPYLEDWTAHDNGDRTLGYLYYKTESIEALPAECEHKRYEKITTGKLLLPDAGHLGMMWANRDILGEKYYMAKPTAKCVETTESKADGLSPYHYFSYWTNIPHGDVDNQMRIVHADGSIGSEYAYNGEVGGIRPAFYLESGISFALGRGTEQDPYILDTPEDVQAAEEAVSAINRIPDPVVATEECEAQIKEAREAYDGLSAEQKLLVPDEAEAKLAKAEEDLPKALQAAAEQKIIDGVTEMIDAACEAANGEITLENVYEVKDMLDAAERAYQELDAALQMRLLEKHQDLKRAMGIYDGAITMNKCQLWQDGVLVEGDIYLRLGTETASRQFEVEIEPYIADILGEKGCETKPAGIVEASFKGHTLTLNAVAAGETKAIVFCGAMGFNRRVVVERAPEGTVKVSSVRINKSKATLDIKESPTLELTASVNPANADQSLIWSSDDESVATVTGEGNTATVCAVAKGEATITARSAFFPAMKATCKLTVEGPELVFADASVEEGKDTALTPELTPKDTPVYAIRYRIAKSKEELGESASSDIISIDYEKDPDGGEFAGGLVPVTVTGIKEGKAYVWVEVNYDNPDGDPIHPLSAICEVTVTEVKIPEEIKTALEEAKMELNAYLDEDALAKYDEEDQEKIGAIVANALENLDGAEDSEAIQAALALAEGEIAGILTKEQKERLSTEKSQAKEAMEAFLTDENAALYRENEWKILTGLVNDALADIEGTADLDAVQAVLRQAMAAAQAVKTDAQLTEEEAQKPVGPVTGDPENPDPEKPGTVTGDPEKPGTVTGDLEKPDPEKPDPEKPDPEKPDPEKPDPEKTDPEKQKLEEGDFVMKGNLKFVVLDPENKTVSVCGTASAIGKKFAVSIPPTIEIKGSECKVTEVEKKGFVKFAKITKVTLGKNIVKVGKNAFDGCKALKSLTVSGDVETFDSKCFNGCKKLNAVTFKGKKVPAFKSKAFKGTASKVKVKFAKMSKGNKAKTKKRLKQAGMKKIS